MDDRTNTIAGWVLAGCAAAVGLSIVGGMIFLAFGLWTAGYAVGLRSSDFGDAAAWLVCLRRAAAPAEPTPTRRRPFLELEIANAGNGAASRLPVRL